MIAACISNISVGSLFQPSSGLILVASSSQALIQNFISIGHQLTKVNEIVSWLRQKHTELDFSIVHAFLYININILNPNINFVVNLYSYNELIVFI